MTTVTCIAITLLLIVLFPLHLLLWATESRNVRIQRLRRNGWTWKRIAEHYGCSQRTARRWATA